MKYLLFFLFFPFLLLAQKEYPKDYFRSPLDIPLFLAGNFGELRYNHFHTGLDFKTNQKEGLKVYAAADGYVSRIKISAFGYGKAIYITHPNGFTTVYGHLSKANSIIESYIKATHYKEQAYEIEMFPQPEEFPIKLGDIIAFSGNTGGSGGPHLHFEFRDTPTEKIINPMLFGFNTKIIDTKLPVMTSLVVYPIDKNGIVNESQIPILINVSLQKNKSYLAEKVVAAGKIGFGISAYDLYDFNYSKNGLYNVQTFLNGTPNFGYQFDTFGFDETRFVNALLDYPRLMKTGMRVQKLFMKNPYPFSPIRTDESNGILNVLPNITNNYRIELADFNNNKITVNIPIEYSTLAAKILNSDKKTNYYLKSQNDASYKKDNVSVFVPAKSFYEDLYLNFEVKNDTLTFQDDTVALQNAITITFQNDKVTETERLKMFIATIDGTKLRYNNTKIKGKEFITYTKNLGQFVLAKDTVAPSIAILNFKEGTLLKKQTNIQLKIADLISGIKEYKGFLNGKWVLFEYDYKTKKITHELDSDFLIEGRNDLKIEVVDNVGNSTIFDTYFFYKKL